MTSSLRCHRAGVSEGPRQTLPNLHPALYFANVTTPKRGLNVTSKQSPRLRFPGRPPVNLSLRTKSSTCLSYKKKKKQKGGERGGGEWAGWVVSAAFPPPRAEPGANTGTKSRPRVSPAPSKQAPSEGIPPNPGGKRPKGPSTSCASTYKSSGAPPGPFWGQKQRCRSTSGVPGLREI